MTTEELDNSMQFNDMERRYEVNASEILTRLWEVIYSQKNYSANSKQSDHLRLILSKLYSCHKSHYDCLAFSRTSNDYTPNSSGEPFKVSYKIFVHIVNSLIQYGYIEQCIGFNYRNTNKPMYSRMRANDTLIEFIESIQLPLRKTISDNISNDSIFIILRDENKKKVDYRLYETDLTKEWNLQLINYNKLISESTLSLASAIDQKVNIDKTRIVRIFNDMSFGLGGRYYGGWWLNMKSKFRPLILINGEPTVEIDFKSFHLILAYAMEGINYFEDIGDDPYLIDSVVECSEHRSLVKTILLTCFNAKSRSSACRAINLEIRDGRLKKHPKYKTSNLIDLCISKHDRVYKYFYSDSGKLLQFYDSHVASHIIKHFTDKGILVLCIHDSFVIQQQYGESLNRFMIDSVYNSFGFVPVVK